MSRQKDVTVKATESRAIEEQAKGTTRVEREKPLPHKEMPRSYHYIALNVHTTVDFAPVNEWSIACRRAKSKKKM